MTNDLPMSQQLATGFGQWLKRKREDARLTFEQVAERADLTKSYIWNLENAKPHPISGAYPRPRIEKVDAIAKALDVPVSEARLAAGYKPDETPETEEGQKLLAYFNQ
ncbi:MAG TPA: helix-turn-helix transcriptional regulator, partial [Blastocatellia bacterium]|nr:helix-turn-helix transcriptional regulator [Blastocatellia bacterium]